MDAPDPASEAGVAVDDLARRRYVSQACEEAPRGIPQSSLKIRTSACGDI